MIIVSINYSGWIISELIDEFNDVRNMIIYLIFTPAVHLFLVFMNLEREMKMRLQFNNDRILEVETEKSEEDMGKLVPFHILAGIKNDQQIVDMLDNVTILYAKLSFFENDGTMFKGSLNVVQQLASVFNKFDEICEQRQVYKVHSFGDFYVLMSYNGKLPKEKRRNQDLQIEEAYNIILAGFDMLTVVEELQNMGNMIIRNSNLKIGIHTGKIVGALIGQNFVRYDIFGSDVKLTQQIMQESNKN